MEFSSCRGVEFAKCAALTGASILLAMDLLPRSLLPAIVTLGALQLFSLLQTQLRRASDGF